jgi:hypothetical protein
VRDLVEIVVIVVGWFGVLILVRGVFVNRPPRNRDS